MDLVSYYPHLAGSNGTIYLQLGQALLDQLCALMKAQAAEYVQSLRIQPSGPNRIRIKAELSNRLYQWAGALGLRVLREDGIEIQIEQGVATLATLTLQGSMDTTVVGKSVAIPQLVDMINQGIGAGEVIKVKDSQWLGWAQFRLFVTLDPFPLLDLYLPAGMGKDIAQVQLQTTADTIVIDLTWQHDGKPL